MMAGTAMVVSRDLQVSSEDREDTVPRRRRPGVGLPLCSDTYHRTWLVQARRSWLTLLALHAFPARDASLPLHKEGDRGMAMAARPRTPFPLLRGMGLQLAATPVVLRPPPTSPCPGSFPAAPLLSTCSLPSLHVRSGHLSLLGVQGTPGQRNKMRFEVCSCSPFISMPFPSVTALPPCLLVAKTGPGPAPR